MTDWEMLNLLSLSLVLLLALMVVTKSLRQWHALGIERPPIMRGLKETADACVVILLFPRWLIAVVVDVPWPGMPLALASVGCQVLGAVWMLSRLAHLDRHKETNYAQVELGRAELLRQGVPIEELYE